LVLFFKKGLLPLTLRAALYWAPESDDPLLLAGNTWLGRDPDLGASVAQPAVPGIEAATADPRGYGFHATLRPPMRLATGWEEFTEAARALAAAWVPFEMPTLRVVDMAGFLAIATEVPCPALQDLADACVIGTDLHRLRPNQAELACRRKTGLSARQESMLMTWGYPYVMAEWRFHMTLSRRLQPLEMSQLRIAAEAHFAQALACPRRVQSISIFTQHAKLPFLAAERLALG
jgi:hypothetical protein